LFEYCSLKELRCPFAGKYKARLYCGVKTGNLEETRIINLKKCPKKERKKKK